MGRNKAWAERRRADALARAKAAAKIAGEAVEGYWLVSPEEYDARNGPGSYERAIAALSEEDLAATEAMIESVGRRDERGR